MTLATSSSDAVKIIIEQEGKRKLASTISEEWFESKMSAEFKEIRKNLLQIKTGDELDKRLSELDANFTKLKESDSQFFVSQIIPLRALRGISWRLIPLVSETKLAHSFVLSIVKSMYTGANLFFPTNQTTAMSQYLTQPFVEDGVAPWERKGEAALAFAPPSAGGEAQLQAHFKSVVIPMLETAAERILKVQFTNDWRVFDNRLWYGGETFPDVIDRYALVGEVERYTALANIYSAVATFSQQTAYSWNTSLEMNAAISRLYGMDALISSVDGVPLRKRVAVMNQTRFSQWGRLIHPELIQKAWRNMQNAVTSTQNAWQGMKNRPVSEYTMIDNSSSLPFQRPVNARLAGMKNLMEGQATVVNGVTRNLATVVSGITREQIQVDLKGFFANPPENLREMHPTKFVEGKEFESVTLKTESGTKKLEYRNYTIGSGQQWNLTETSKYKVLFPFVKDNADLKLHLRVLSQGWGATALIAPLMDNFY